MPHSWPSLFVRTDLLVIPQLSKELVCWSPTPKATYIADTTSLMGSKLHSLLSLLKALLTHLLDLLVATVESTITLEGETVFTCWPYLSGLFPASKFWPWNSSGP